MADKENYFDLSYCKLYTGALQARKPMYIEDYIVGEEAKDKLFDKGSIFYIEYERENSYCLINNIGVSIDVKKDLINEYFKIIVRKKQFKKRRNYNGRIRNIYS